MSVISIAIPPDFLNPENQDLEETDLREYLADLIKDDKGELDGELLRAFDTDHGDDRAQLDDVDIEDVEVDGDLVHVHFITSHSAYYGCDDANWSAEDHRSVTGRKIGDKWVFDVFVAPERTPPDLEGPDEY